MVAVVVVDEVVVVDGANWPVPKAVDEVVLPTVPRVGEVVEAPGVAQVGGFGGTKFSTGTPARARVMKSRHASAGIVPPKTWGRPLMLTRGWRPVVLPIHTEATSCGV